MLSPEHRQILADRLLGDDLVLSALDALCRQEAQAALARLVDHGQKPFPSLVQSVAQVAVDAREAQFWTDLVDTLRRRVKEKPQEAPA